MRSALRIPSVPRAGPFHVRATRRPQKAQCKSPIAYAKKATTERMGGHALCAAPINSARVGIPILARIILPPREVPVHAHVKKGFSGPKEARALFVLPAPTAAGEHLKHAHRKGPRSLAVLRFQIAVALQGCIHSVPSLMVEHVSNAR